AVLLHQARHLEVDALVGGEALLAGCALAAPARGVGLEVRPGIDHLGLLRAAEGAFHGEGAGWLNRRAYKPLFSQQLESRSFLPFAPGRILFPALRRDILKRRQVI